VLPEAAVIRRALAASFSRLADALSQNPPSQEQEEERAVLIARVAELEAEREWKPWPPEVRDGRRILYCNPGSRVLTIMTARSGIGYAPPGFFRELGSVPGDDHA
jgi:hypothetical protein